MERQEFESLCEKHQESLEAIRATAHRLHENVNQFYDKDKPYGFHLDMVAKEVYNYGHLVLADEQDLLPLFMGAWFHDSIEDARVSYNDVKKIALTFGLNEEQTFMAAEIVYALTNDKGRNRKERAGKRYYEGIRITPYAPFVKMCDLWPISVFLVVAITWEICVWPRFMRTRCRISNVPLRLKPPTSAF